jgi:hypothetical protein
MMGEGGGKGIGLQLKYINRFPRGLTRGNPVMLTKKLETLNFMLREKGDLRVEDLGQRPRQN